MFHIKTRNVENNSIVLQGFEMLLHNFESLCHDEENKSCGDSYKRVVSRKTWELGRIPLI
jgi:hypothetical protein